MKSYLFKTDDNIADYIKIWLKIKFSRICFSHLEIDQYNQYVTKVGLAIQGELNWLQQWFSLTQTKTIHW